MESVYPESELTSRIILAAVEVHRHLGPGLLESAYEACLCRELSLQGIDFTRQMVMSVTYKGEDIDCGYRMDLVVQDRVIIELKTVEKILPIHEAQLLTYLKLAQKKVGLILNFHCHLMKDGIKRMVL
jgi:GxxExxY protein